MLFTLGMTFSVVLVVTLFPALALGSLVLNVGFDVFPFFAGFFPGDLAALDGFGELSSGLGDELVAAAFFFTLGGLLLIPGLHRPELFAGIFPRELACLDGLDDFLPGLGGLVASAFGFTLGLGLVATFALGGFPGILISQASFVGLDGFFESCVGILLGDFAFLDKPVVLLLVFSKLHPALDGLPSFTGFFPGDLAASDRFAELFSGGLVSGTAVSLLTLGLTFGFALGVFLLAVLSLHRPELFAGIFPRELACLDGLDDFLPGSGGLVPSAFGFTLGLGLVATFALGGFLGILISPASFVPGFCFTILGHRRYRNGEDNCCHNS